MSVVDCDKIDRTADEMQYCICQDAIKVLNKKIAAYDEQKIKYALDDASYNRWFTEHTNWKNRSGNYSKYAKHGLSEDFTIDYGDPYQDTNSRCSECAKRKLENGWSVPSGMDGKGMIKNNYYNRSGIMRCDLKPGTSLQGWEYYVDDHTNWGWMPEYWLTRKWWTCTKSEVGKQTELIEYNNAEPLSDPQNPSVNWKVKGKPTSPTIPNFGNMHVTLLKY